MTTKKPFIYKGFLPDDGSEIIIINGSAPYTYYLKASTRMMYRCKREPAWVADMQRNGIQVQFGAWGEEVVYDN